MLASERHYGLDGTPLDKTIVSTPGVQLNLIARRLGPLREAHAMIVHELFAARVPEPSGLTFDGGCYGRKLCMLSGQRKRDRQGRSELNGWRKAC